MNMLNAKKRSIIAILSACTLAPIMPAYTPMVAANIVSAAEMEQVQGIDYLVLVNKTHKLPDDYEANVPLITAKNSMGREFQIERETYAHFVQLRDALLKQGIQIELDSVYRSVARQQEIVKEFTEKYGTDYVRQYVAVPGYSEHHTGLAVDICLMVDGKVIDDNDEMIAQKEIFAKIHPLLADYGFILRYLPGKENITGYSYEPWHFRYVGKDAAKEISRKGLTLEEYMTETTQQRSVSPEDARGFVVLSEIVPDIITEVRYYTTYNFVGDRIVGYEEPCVLMTREAADALKEVSDDVMSQGYRLKIYDAYRPQMAVDHFVRWAEDLGDKRMKEYFYPEVDKTRLFADGYIDAKSGHSRGSTVDLTLFDMKTGKEADMGGTFDHFGIESHPDWCGNPETMQYTGKYKGNKPPKNGEINETQFKNRMILRQAMLRHGFKPLSTEWWHFTMKNEPYPEIYFTFPPHLK